MIYWIFLILSATAFSTDIEKNPLKIFDPHQTVLFKSESPSKVKMQIELPSGYKGYTDTVKISSAPTQNLVIQNLKINPEIKFYDKFSNQNRIGFQGVSELEFDLKFLSLPASEKGTLALTLEYQACTKDFCLLPQRKSFSIPYAVMGTPNTSSPSFFDFERKSFALILLIVFIGGILTSFTPCIFPMIPITLSVLGARSVGQTRRKSFFISLIYVLGISVTYSLLGYLAAKSGMLFGSLLSKPEVVLIIVLIFYAMALSMFGIYEIRIPHKLQNRLSKIEIGQGYAGSFFSGLLAGLVASPCVGPILVSILTYAAKLSQPFLGVLLLFSYAMGMGMIFIVMGTFTHFLNKIPKAGPWMNITKFIFGTSLIAVALYYVRNAFSDRIFWGFVSFSLILVTSFYGALDDHKTVTGLKKLRKWAMGSLFIFGFAMGFKVLFTEWSPEKSKMQTSSLWKAYSDSDLEAAIKNKQPVIIDFYADWCAACLELEKFTFSDPQIKNKLQNFMLLKVDATTENDEVSRILTKFDVIGLPTIMFIDSSGNLRKDLTLTGFEPAEDFTKRLDQL